MEKELTREDYKNIKKRYYIAILFLRIFRIFAIIAITFLIVVSVVYTNNPNLPFVQFVTSKMDIVRKILYSLIIVWIVFKIIVILYKARLSKLKRKLDVIDEI